MFFPLHTKSGFSSRQENSDPRGGVALFGSASAVGSPCANMRSLKFTGLQQWKDRARSFAIGKGQILPSWTTCDSCIWCHQGMRYHIWSSNAISYRKTIFMPLSLLYFIFLCWLYAGVGTWYQTIIYLVRMVSITCRKIFFKFNEFAYSTFLYKCSVLFNPARTKSSRE